MDKNTIFLCEGWADIAYDLADDLSILAKTCRHMSDIMQRTIIDMTDDELTDDELRIMQESAE